MTGCDPAVNDGAMLKRENVAGRMHDQGADIWLRLIAVRAGLPDRPAVLRICRSTGPSSPPARGGVAAFRGRGGSLNPTFRVAARGAKVTPSASRTFQNRCRRSMGWARRLSGTHRRSAWWKTPISKTIKKAMVVGPSPFLLI